MTLTPEDVVNKHFKTTKLREGYDQDEVDDFLDEIVLEFRGLEQDTDRLASEIQAARVKASKSVVSKIATKSKSATAAKSKKTSVLAGASATNETSEASNDLLVVARKLHEEHVNDGLEKRDAIIADANLEAENIRTANAMQIKEFEIILQAHQEKIDALEVQRSALEKQVEDLLSFESEYRKKLREYIESHLNDLNDAAIAEK